MEISIHAAGVAHAEPGPGGYAAVIQFFKDPVVVHGNSPSASTLEMETKAMMETKAVLEGVREARMMTGGMNEDVSITVHTDSATMAEAARKAITTPEGELQRELASIAQGMDIRVSHDEQPENEHAGRIARAWADARSRGEKTAERDTYTIPPVWEGPPDLPLNNAPVAPLPF